MALESVQEKFYLHLSSTFPELKCFFNSLIIIVFTVLLLYITLIKSAIVWGSDSNDLMLQYTLLHTIIVSTLGGYEVSKVVDAVPESSPSLLRTLSIASCETCFLS